MEIGKLFLIVGVVFLVIGAAVTFLPNLGQLPRLPGDIYIKRDNFVFYFPVVTSILVSIVLSLILGFFFRK